MSCKLLTLLTAVVVLASSAAIPAFAKQTVCINPHGKTVKYLVSVTNKNGTRDTIWSEEALRAELIDWFADDVPDPWETFKAVVASGNTALLEEPGGKIYVRVCAADPEAPLSSPETGAANR